MAEYREKILTLARIQPVQPSGVAKALSTNSIMAGAMLSELAAKGMLRISALKVGGSPLYFIPGQDSQLERYLHVLNEKDQKTCTVLKTEGVLRDSTSDPLTRVSLRAIKDFAKPLEVTHSGGKELFWKWHSLPAPDAELRIKGMLGIEQQPAPKAPEPAALTVPEQKPATVQTQLPPAQPLAPVPQVVEQPAPKPRPKRPPRQAKPLDPAADLAYAHVTAFFGKNAMHVLEHRMLRKGLHDFVVEIETPLGRSSVHCRALAKARVNDADLGDAYAEGQLRRLQTVVLTAGQLTKAALERLPALKGLGVKRI